MNMLANCVTNEEVQSWISTDNLKIRNTRTFGGFQITDDIDGGHAADREVSLVRLTNSNAYPQHVHERSDALIIVVSGDGVLLSGVMRVAIGIGHIVPILRGTPHGFQVNQHLEFVSIQWPPIRDPETGLEDLHPYDADDLLETARGMDDQKRHI